MFHSANPTCGIFVVFWNFDKLMDSVLPFNCLIWLPLDWTANFLCDFFLETVKAVKHWTVNAALHRYILLETMLRILLKCH